jgi:hypothetical protein
MLSFIKAAPGLNNKLYKLHRLRPITANLSKFRVQGYCTITVVGLLGQYKKINMKLLFLKKCEAISAKKHLRHS